MWEFVDKIIYINLDHREDRRQIMKEFFEKGGMPNEKIVRFPGIIRKIGGLGCLESHAGALQMAKDNNWKNVLILEDDLEWIDLEKEYPKLLELVSLPTWDVIQLVGWYIKYDFPRIFHTLNAGAYLVNNHYYDKLLRNRRVSIRRFKSVDRYFNPTGFTADVSWNSIAKNDNWYGLYPCICQQKATYSDNLGKIYRADLFHGIYPGAEGKRKILLNIQNAEQQDAESRK